MEKNFIIFTVKCTAVFEVLCRSAEKSLLAFQARHCIITTFVHSWAKAPCCRCAEFQGRMLCNAHLHWCASWLQMHFCGYSSYGWPSRGHLHSLWLWVKGNLELANGQGISVCVHETEERSTKTSSVCVWEPTAAFRVHRLPTLRCADRGESNCL